MPKASPIQTAFNSGELSPRLEGRVDLTRYQTGCSTMENFIPMVHGGAIKRSGTRYVYEVKDSSADTILIPFEFNTDQAYIIEFGNLYMRFYKDGAVILDSGSPYEVATPFTTADLRGLKYAQSADVLYVASKNHPPQKISRTADTSWTVTEIAFDWVPFLDENLDDSLTVYASAATGTSITLTASSALFDSTMVDGYFKFREVPQSKHDIWADGESIGSTGLTRTWEGNVYESSTTGTTGSRAPIHETGTESDGAVDWDFLHPGEGYVKITGFTSTTVVTADVVKRLPDSIVGSSNATSRWSLGAWSDYHGYPGTVAFFEDRLIWAGTTADPQRIWGSASGDYENLKTGTSDDDSFSYTINTDKVNVIEWLLPDDSLLIGTAGGEFIMNGGTQRQPITPTNVRITRQTTYGSRANLQALRVGNASLFVQRSGKKLREFISNYNDDIYEADDLTVLSEHITDGKIKSMAYQQEPNQLIWFALEDGGLVCLTYERAQEVIGWHRHSVSGNVESVAAIPHPDGDQDQLWMIVNRTINGATKRYIEYLEKEWDGSLAAGNEFFVDSGESYSGAATTTITGLTRLEGETVSILADGATHPDKTVSSGSITLDRSATTVQVGLGYNATLSTMRFNNGAADGTAQGKTKRITNVTLRMYQTGAGLWVGPDTTNMEEIQFRDEFMEMDSPVDLFTGDKGPQSWPGGYEQAGKVAVQHRLPLPCSVLAVMPQMVTQDR